MSTQWTIVFKDPLMLFWATTGTMILLEEGKFAITVGDDIKRQSYLTKVGDEGGETFTHVRDKDGLALLPRAKLIDILLTKEYTVS